jgi:hypothetical protein
MASKFTLHHYLSHTRENLYLAFHTLDIGQQLPKICVSDPAA